MRRVILSVSIILVGLFLAIPSMAASIVNYGVMTYHSYYRDRDTNKTSYFYIWYLDADAETDAWYKCSDIGVNDYAGMVYSETYSNSKVKDYGYWRAVDPSEDWGGFSFWFAVGDRTNPDDEVNYTLPTGVYRFVPFVKNVAVNGRTISWSGSNDPNVDKYVLRARDPNDIDNQIFFKEFAISGSDSYSFTFSDELNGYDQVQLLIEAYELDDSGKPLNKSRYIMNYTPVPIPGSGFLMLSAIGLFMVARRKIMVS